jgi:hypothetical protein
MHHAAADARPDARTSRTAPRGGKMMNTSGTRMAGVALVALFAAASAQAQEVHKCTVNGAVTYQPTPCPQDDVMLEAPATPSDQEIRQARADQSRQHYQAASGWIMRPTRVAPPRPAPPPPPPVVTTTTTIIFFAGDLYPALIIRQQRAAAARSSRTLTNCEQLNVDNENALERRDLLRLPDERAAHPDLLKDAEADVARVTQLAKAGYCRLNKH